MSKDVIFSMERYIAKVAKQPESDFFKELRRKRGQSSHAIGRHIGLEVKEHIREAAKLFMELDDGAPSPDDPLFEELVGREIAGTLSWEKKNKKETPKCTLCEKHFDNLAEFSLHIANADGISCGMMARPPPKCTFCNTKFKSYGNTKRHAVTVHTNTRPLVGCPFCEKLFVTEGNVRRHVEQLHPENAMEYLKIHPKRPAPHLSPPRRRRRRPPVDATSPCSPPPPTPLRLSPENTTSDDGPGTPSQLSPESATSDDGPGAPSRLSPLPLPPFHLWDRDILDILEDDLLTSDLLDLFNA